jgi:hypothetical protein
MLRIKPPVATPISGPFAHTNQRKINSKMPKINGAINKLSNRKTNQSWLIHCFDLFLPVVKVEQLRELFRFLSNVSSSSF